MMTKLNSLLCYLYPDYVKRADKPHSIESYTFEYTYPFGTAINSEVVHVRPYMIKKDLDNLLRKAINADLDAMRIVSMMYNAGYILPESQYHAIQWMAFTQLTVESMSFEDAVSDLKKHRKDILSTISGEPDSVIWPSQVTDSLYKAVNKLTKIQTVKSKRAPAKSYILPKVRGLQLFLMYRAHKVDGQWQSFMYGAFINHPDGLQILTADKLLRLDVPRRLTELRGDITQPNYMPFGDNVRLYVVEGALYVPKNKRKRMKKNFPDVKSYGDLFEAYLEALYKPVLSKPSADAKDTSWYPPYRDKLPQTYLTFISTNLYTYSKKRFNVAKLLHSTNAHLQTLGFATVRHPLLDMVTYTTLGKSKTELTNILSSFRDAFPNIPIDGLFIRPEENVNIRKCFVYKD